MKKLIISALCSISSVAFGQVLSGGGVGQPPSEPILMLSFQEQLWSDLWSETFRQRKDAIISTQSASDASQIIHRLDWDPAQSFLDAAPSAGSIVSVNTWDMDWLEESPQSIAISIGDDDEWLASVTSEVHSFSGQISAFGEYEPFIYGVVWELSFIEDPSIGQVAYHISMWVPLGRGLTLDSVEAAAEELAEEIEPLPGPIADSTTCFGIYLLRRDTHTNDYFIDIDACGGDGLGGAGIGAGVGVGFGAIVGNFPGAILFTGIGAAIGGGIDYVTGKSKCIKNAKDQYNKDYNRDWNCYQECLLNGSWTCG